MRMLASARVMVASNAALRSTARFLAVVTLADLVLEVAMVIVIVRRGVCVPRAQRNRFVPFAGEASKVLVVALLDVLQLGRMRVPLHNVSFRAPRELVEDVRPCGREDLEREAQHLGLASVVGGVLRLVAELLGLGVLVAHVMHQRVRLDATELLVQTGRLLLLGRGGERRIISLLRADLFVRQVLGELVVRDEVLGRIAQEQHTARRRRSLAVRLPVRFVRPAAFVQTILDVLLRLRLERARDKQRLVSLRLDFALVPRVVVLVVLSEPVNLEVMDGIAGFLIVIVRLVPRVVFQRVVRTVFAVTATKPVEPTLHKSEAAEQQKSNKHFDVQNNRKIKLFKARR